MTDEKHFHVASGLSDGRVVYYEKQYDNADESIADFLGLGGNLFRETLPDRALAEYSLRTMSDTIERTIVFIGQGSPISLFWAVCDGCSGLPWRN